MHCISLQLQEHVGEFNMEYMVFWRVFIILKVSQYAEQESVEGVTNPIAIEVQFCRLDEHSSHRVGIQASILLMIIVVIVVVVLIGFVCLLLLFYFITPPLDTF